MSRMEEVEEYRKKYAGIGGHIWMKIDLAKNRNYTSLLNNVIDIANRIDGSRMESQDFFKKVVNNIFSVDVKDCTKEQLNEIKSIIEGPISDALRFLVRENKELHEVGNTITEEQRRDFKIMEFQENRRLDGMTGREKKDTKINEKNLIDDHSMIGGELGGKK